MNEVKALYTEFKSNIICGNRLCYDEDNLIDIFDYARDLGDIFVQIEVILQAARVYPESAELLIRRGFLYEDTDDLSFGSFIEANRNNPQLSRLFLWKLISLEKKIDESPERYDKKTVVDCLCDIINDSEWLYDEDIFQLRDFVIRGGCGVEFLQSRMDVSTKVDNLATWYYETGCIALESDSPEEGIDYLIKSSDIDGFRIQTWLMLAASYIDQSKYSEAEYALDFAASLRDDPEMYEQEMLLNSKVISSDTCRKRALELCGLIDINLIRDNAFQTYVDLLMDDNRIADAQSIILNRMRNRPGIDLFLLLVRLFPECALEAVEFITHLFRDDDRQEIYEELFQKAVIPTLIRINQVEAALKIAGLAGMQAWNQEWFYDILLANYYSEKYDMLVELEMLDILEEISVPLSFFIAFGYANLGKTEVALRICREGKRKMKSYDNKGLTSAHASVWLIHGHYLSQLEKEIAGGSESFRTSDYPLI